MQKIHITVDAIQETGELSPVWRPSLMIGPECQALRKFEEEIGYKYTYNLWVITSNVQSTGFSDTTLDPLISKIEEAGGLTILTIWGIPRWLTTYIGDLGPYQEDAWGSSPPKDYDKWKEIVYSVVKHYSVDCGFKNILYEPWNEPDEQMFWLGTPEEYLKLYKYSALAVREIEEEFGVEVKIGGPRTTSWNRWIHWFIKFCGEEKLPLDFVSWHFFVKNPRNIIGSEGISKTRNYLRQYGFDPETPQIIDEWSVWPEDDLAPAYRNDEKYASFIPATLYALDKSGIYRQCFFGLQNIYPDPDKIAPEYIGERDYAVITPHGIVKPSYNVLLLLTKLGERKLSMSISDDSYISGVATRYGGKISILIGHYVPIEKEKEKELIPREMAIDIRNLPGGCYHYEMYLVDESHSNSYAVRERFFSDMAKMRAQCLEKTKESMAEQGCAEENIKLFGEIADELTVYSRYSRYSRKAREMLDSMSQPVREEIKKMMETYAGLYNHEVIEIARQVNEWQEVKLQKVEEREIEINEPDTSHCEQLVLSPYSVCLITLDKKR